MYWAFDEQLAVRDGDWKLIVGPRAVDPDAATPDGAPTDDDIRLATLDVDPAESRNRAVDEPATVEDLAADARQWRDGVLR